jgi:hypothetical protein
MGLAQCRRKKAWIGGSLLCSSIFRFTELAAESNAGTNRQTDVPNLNFTKRSGSATNLQRVTTYFRELSRRASA